ncbi:unnamed protein product [Strongylus vulgaris]|uniref:Uncharacterized protein n=1 Tax=Strongylus vulgaris TaxID=40348 RepID=A0A3P7IKE8_STRVU|nr:unnamed protein product [Strongylus vulgaris]
MTSPDIDALSRAYGRLTLGKLAPKHIEFFTADNYQSLDVWHRDREDLVRNAIPPIPEHLKVYALFAVLKEDARDKVSELQPKTRTIMTR